MDTFTSQAALVISSVITTSSNYTSSINESSTPGDAIVEEFGAINLYVLLPLTVLLQLMTISGNVVVMICVRIDKRLAAAISSYYVFSMAGADAVVGLLVMGGMAVYTLYGYWPLGNAWCTTWVTIDYSCCTVSMLHLCLIAYDRYKAVVKPIEYRQNHSTTNSAHRAIWAWVLGVIAWAPAAIVFGIVTPLPENDCFYFPTPHYVVVQAIIVYWGPIIIMSIFYVKCVSTLRLRYAKTVADTGDGPKRFLPAPASNGTRTATTNGTDTEVEGQELEAVDPNAVVSQAKLSKQQQQLRSIRTLGVVMGLFLFCWVPFCLFWPIMAYCPTCINFQLFEYSYWMAYVNSGINPFLYFISNRDFRSAFMTMIGRAQPE